MKYLEAVEYREPLTAKKDGILGGEALNAPMKFLLNYGSNAMLNMHPDINYTKKVIEDESKLEMIIVYDNHLVPSALYADILLPDVSSIEREDIIQPTYNAGTDAVVYMNPAVSPMFECRDAYWVAHQLSKRLGLEEQFSGGKTKAEWLEYVHELARAKDPSLTTFEQFKKQGLQKLKNPGEPYVALKDFREDPESHPLNTPSGKIEIYSVKMAKALETGALDRSSGLPLLPEFTTGSGSYNDPLTQEYPLQLIGFHGKTRANSSYANVSFLKEITDKLWINPIDAKPRAVKHGERVEVYNDRGRLTIEAKVTIRIMPGVIAAPIGTWHKPDSDGVDHASQLNVLTMKESSPYCKGSTQHTILADVRVWNKRA
jgi:anaerobic dimethyl sulfoxide reductase subunit A